MSNMHLSVEELLDLIEDSFVDHRGENIRGRCPYCNDDGLEFGISIKREGQPFNCFRKKKCGEFGPLVKLLRFIGREDLVGETTKVGAMLPELIEARDEVVEVNLEEVNLPLGFKRTYQHDYLDDRGFVFYDKYVVGTTQLERKFRDYLIIAVQEYGKTYGYLGRHTWSNRKLEAYNKKAKKLGRRKIPKYKNHSSNFDVLLYGMDEITAKTDTLIIVEGVFDKWNMDKLLKLHDSDEVKCVATFGAHFTSEQKYRIKTETRVRRLLFFHEPDVLKVVKAEIFDVQFDFEVQAAAWTGSKDPGDFELSDLDEVRLLSPEEYFRKLI